MHLPCGDHNALIWMIAHKVLVDIWSALSTYSQWYCHLWPQYLWTHHSCPPILTKVCWNAHCPRPGQMQVYSTQSHFCWPTLISSRVPSWQICYWSHISVFNSNLPYWPTVFYLTGKPGTDTITSLLSPLRPLLSTKNEFLWSPTHDEAFSRVKASLTAPPVLSFFSIGKATRLSTDASRQGLGFILQQKTGDKWTLIQAGSRFLSDAESRYAIIELEMLAVVWAVHKCKMFLSGLQHYSILTDHNPLVPILNTRVAWTKSRIVTSSVWSLGSWHIVFPPSGSKAVLMMPLMPFHATLSQTPAMKITLLSMMHRTNL